MKYVAEANVYTALQGIEDQAVIFAQLTQRDGSFLVGREPIENFSLELLGEMERAEIIGGRAGGAPEMTLEYVLKTNGLDIGVIFCFIRVSDTHIDFCRSIRGININHDDQITTQGHTCVIDC